MKAYLVSFAVGTLAGLLYSVLDVKSPAPPTIALIGLLGMLLGEQAVPVAQKMLRKEPVLAFVKTHAARRVLGDHIKLPTDNA
jgi:XapX domain-containing protein